MPKPGGGARYAYRHRGWRYPTPVYVFVLHDAIMAADDKAAGVLDEGRVLSALDAPTRGFGGLDLYPTPFWKVAALGFLIANNHGFADGNKRTALLTVETTLRWNGEYPQWSQESKALVFKLVGAGHLSLEGLRYALLSACGHDVDQYDDLQAL